MSTSMEMEATSFSKQATAARRDYFASSNSGVVGQDVRDVGDVVEKFTAHPRGAGGYLPLRSRHCRSGGPPLHPPTSEAALAAWAPYGVRGRLIGGAAARSARQPRHDPQTCCAAYSSRF